MSNQSHHKNLDFKDAAASRFGHSDLVFHLSKETQLIALLSNFFETLRFLGITESQKKMWLQVKNATNSGY